MRYGAGVVMIEIFAKLTGVSQSANAGVVDRISRIKARMTNLFSGIPIFNCK